MPSFDFSLMRRCEICGMTGEGTSTFQERDENLPANILRIEMRPNNNACGCTYLRTSLPIDDPRYRIVEGTTWDTK